MRWLAMFTVALISRKGGAGKTTLACGLAVSSEQGGLVTALVDLDPQGSALLTSRSLAISRQPEVDLLIESENHYASP